MRILLTGPDQDWDVGDSSVSFSDAGDEEQEEIPERELRSPAASRERRRSSLSPHSLSLTEEGLERMEKVMLERLLERKELRLVALQQKVGAQNMRLLELETRLRLLEELPGFPVLEWVAALVKRSGRWLQNWIPAILCLLPGFFYSFLKGTVTTDQERKMIDVLKKRGDKQGTEDQLVRIYSD